MPETPPTDSAWLQAFLDAMKPIAKEEDDDPQDDPQTKLIKRLAKLLESGSEKQKEQLNDLLESLSPEQQEKLNILLQIMPLEQQEQLRALQKAMPRAQAVTIPTQNSFNAIPPIKIENPRPTPNKSPDNKSSEQSRIEAERAAVNARFNPANSDSPHIRDKWAAFTYKNAAEELDKPYYKWLEENSFTATRANDDEMREQWKAQLPDGGKAYKDARDELSGIVPPQPNDVTPTPNKPTEPQSAP